MPKCLVDGKEIEFTPGENLIEVAKRGGVEIPYFCYHPGLSVVAQCRMCAVEIEKMPKLQTACSTPPTEGMIIRTQSDRVKKNQKAIMEFLLMNHPLDCPICDKSGECDLQDNSFNYGDSYMRSTEERRSYMDLDMGPVIKKNMNRCIHCTRCIRFGDEIAGIHEMVAIKRGNNTEITTIDGKQLETEYAGNYSDICPTGSLTLKDFRFKKRAWYLKKTATVCEGCSKGCNIEIQEEKNIIYRCVPRVNMEINRYWMCDEGRFNYHYVNSPTRVVEPVVKKSGTATQVPWSESLAAAKVSLKNKSTTVLVGTDLTQEELEAILHFSSREFTSAKVQHFGTHGINKTTDDETADGILKRKSKTSNLFGAEKLGIQPYTGPASGDCVIIFRGGRAVIPTIKATTKIGIGVFEQSNDYDVILPATSFLEKDGSIYNFEGRQQQFKRSIMPVGKSKQISEIIMLWMNKGMGSGAA